MFVVLVVLAFVAPGPAVYAGLGLILLICAWSLTSGLPSAEGPHQSGRTDFGAERRENTVSAAVSKGW